jgi:DNA replication protein DnaC
MRKYRNRNRMPTYQRHSGPPKELKPGHLERMNIPFPYWDATLEVIREKDDLAARKTLSKYIKDIRRAMDIGYGMIINGEYGTGKTSAGVILLKYLRRISGMGYFITAHEYIQDVFSKTMFDEITSVYERVRDVDLLLLDDLGKETSKLDSENDNVATMLVSLLKDRGAAGRSTIITSNLNLGELQKVYGKSFMEAVKDRMAIVTLHTIRRSNDGVRAFFGEE